MNSNDEALCLSRIIERIMKNLMILLTIAIDGSIF